MNHPTDQVLKEHVLTADDAATIRRYLDDVDQEHGQ